MKKYRITTLAIGLLLLSGCSSQSTPTLNIPLPTTKPQPTATEMNVLPIEPVEHIIAIRQGANGGEFYNKITNQTFVPIGANLIQFHPPEGDLTFTIGDYDHGWMDEQLAEMEALGFNTLRVFIDLCKNRCIDAPGGGLRAEFIDNLADFLHLAKEHNIYVILTSNDLPEVGTYDDDLPCCDPFGGYRGSYYLSSAGVNAWKIYLSDVAKALIQAGAPTEVILAYQINNEQFFLTDIPPLSLDQGIITAANGQHYDMSSPEEKRALAEDGLIYFADQVRTAILEVDPTAMVTIGFFPPDEPYPARNDNRLVLTSRFIQESSLDFYDLHPYDWGSISLTQEAENFGILEGYNEKPLLMGEFGAFTYLYDSPDLGAQAMVLWQVASCQYGFDGWLYWLWGERDFNNEVWTGSQGDGAINNALAPIFRPDPCDPGEYAAPLNLAINASLRYSASLAESPAEFAVDGLNNTHWGAGASAPQWIQLEFETPATITEIRLLVSQYPDGATHHRVRGQLESGEWVILADFKGDTQDGDWLEIVFDLPYEGIKVIIIETLSSPSWVAWYEIVVIGAVPD